MGGYNLNEGLFRNKNVSEKYIWDAFKNAFSSEAVKASSYKFVFFKSLIDSIKKYDYKEQYAFFEIFERFTDIYWVLIVKYGLIQLKSGWKNLRIENILWDYVGITVNDVKKIQFCDLTNIAKNKLISQVEDECKKYVIGALYEDTQELFYSFSKKEKTIQINPIVLKFLKNHHSIIEEINYYELAVYLSEINDTKALKRIVKANNYEEKNEDIMIYRKMLFDEFEKILIYEDLKNNSDALEKVYLKNLTYINKSINDDIQYVKDFFDIPKTINEMIRIRNQIVI